MTQPGAVADTVSPRALLELALVAAREAGDLLVRTRPQGLRAEATKTSPTDVVTEMDRASERLLRERLLARRPGDAILGEEGGASSGSSGVRWVIDPVDGTVNYLYGLPHWAVSVAAEVAGQVVAGVVHAPELGHTWTATVDSPACRDGLPVSVSDPDGLAMALVATGFGYTSARRARQARVLTGVLPRVRDIRRAGAASVDLCLVASGAVDGYYEQGLKPWDLAAGALIATRAGARVGGLSGQPPGERMLVAAAPGIFDELVGLLAALDADDDPRADPSTDPPQGD